MIKVGQVEIQNCPAGVTGYAVVRVVLGALWYWGCWDTKEEAERVIHDNGFANGVVVKLD